MTRLTVRDLFRIFGLAALAALGGPAARAERVAIEAELLHTMGPAGTIENGVVLIEDGKIKAVGRARDVKIPRGTERLSAKVATPGLVDAHSVVALSGFFNVPGDQDQSEETDPNQAELRAIDAFNPAEPLLGYLLSLGVTTIQTGPAPVNPIAGQAGVFKTAGRSVAEMTVKFPSAMCLTLGEAPKDAYGSNQKAPGTRMGTAALLRAALNEAAIYDKKRIEAETAKPDEKGEKPDPPDRDLKKEALAALLRGEMPALVTAHRQDDLLTAARLAEEFGLKLIFDGATEAYLIPAEIKKSGAPVIVHPTMQRLEGLEMLNTSLENAAILADAGIRIAIQSGYETYVPKTRVALFEAGVAAANGLGAERALRSITIDAAAILGLEARVGSLEPGKDGDVALFGGDPFEYLTPVEAVILDGVVRHRRAAEAKN